MRGAVLYRASSSIGDSHKIHQPSTSLLKKVFYPESYKFSSPAVHYGCEHEKDAREQHKTQMMERHNNFVVSSSVFFC